MAPNDNVAHATRQFTIPESPADQDGKPFDLGEIRPKLRATLNVGDLAPLFDVETLDGTRCKLSDYRGKYVLLDFWATWCGPCLAEIPEMRTIHDEFAKDPRFALISLSLDAEKEPVRKLVKEKGLKWTQGFLGPGTDNPTAAAYHVEAIPAMFLIGPDGKIAATNLRGLAIRPAVAQVLGAR